MVSAARWCRPQRRTPETTLEPGDRVVFYTDGVVAARAASGEQFGIDRLGEFIARAAAAHEPAAETVRRLIHSVLDHEAGNLHDDATVILLGGLDRAECHRPPPSPQ